MGWLQQSCFIPVLAAGAQWLGWRRWALQLTHLTEQGTLLCPELGTG